MNASPQEIQIALAFVYFALAGIDNEIDARERRKVMALVGKWLPRLDKVKLRDAVASGKDQIESFYASGCPQSVFVQRLEFLADNLTFGNRRAILKDLHSLAGVSDGLDEDEESLIELASLTWAVPKDDDGVTSWSLPSNHFSRKIRFESEEKLTAALRDSFGLQNLSTFLNAKSRERCELARKESVSRGHGVSALLLPRVRRLVDEVAESLKLEETIECYVVEEAIANAHVFGGLNHDGVHYITLTSALVRAMNDVQLRFVIGHEIGHVLYNVNDLGIFLHEAYDDEDANPSMALRHLFGTWSKWIEFSADRIGLVACGDRLEAINALYRVCTGLNPSETGFSADDYLEGIEKLDEEPIDFEIFQQDTHPPLPLRLKALDLFANSETFRSLRESTEIKEDEDLQARMKLIASKADFYSPDPLHSLRILTVALGGFCMINQGSQSGEAEMKKVEEILRLFVLDPAPVIRFVRQMLDDGDDVEEALWNALAVLVHENPEERFPLLHFFFDVTTADGQLNEIEYSFLFALGGHMGFSPEEVGSILIKRIGGGSFLEMQVPQSIRSILGRPEAFPGKQFAEPLGFADSVEQSEEPLCSSEDDINAEGVMESCMSSLFDLVINPMQEKLAEAERQQLSLIVERFQEIASKAKAFEELQKASDD